MQASNQVFMLLKKFEGFRSRAYLCPAGVPTIGYGFTKDVKLGDVMTQDQANERLKVEVSNFAKRMHNILSQYNIDVNQNQFDALVSFAYNVGLENFINSTLFKKLMNGDFVGASNEFSKWVFANKVKLNGLVIRRREERELFNS